MIQTYNDIGSQIAQFESGWNQDGQLQKIYSSARFVSFSLRSMGRTSYLLFGRGKGYEGFWLGDTQIPSQLRKKDQFLEYLRKHLGGARMLGLRLDREDRIIYLSYQKFGKECVLGLFYQGRRLYFANYHYDQKFEHMALFRSWKKGEEPFGDIEKCFEEVGKKPQGTDLKSPKIPSFTSMLEQEEKEGIDAGKTGKKEKRFIKRKILNIERDLEKTSRWPELKEWLEVQENLSALPQKTQVKGVRLKFKENSHFRRRDEIYDKIKKLRKGMAIQKERLALARSVAEGTLEKSAESSLDVIKPVWSKQATEEKKAVPVGEAGYKTFTVKGFELGVGTSAKGNDQLRKLWAKKNDWWFHLDAATSPHIIVKTKSGVVTPELLEIVAGLMRKNSNGLGEEVNLIYTQVKNIKGITGKPGSVIYKKEKRVRVLSTLALG